LPRFVVTVVPGGLVVAGAVVVVAGTGEVTAGMETE
jgi:hypothetical protein